MNNLRRSIAIVAMVSFSPVVSGCFGTFKLTQNLWHFNDGVSPNKFIKWLVFLGLAIVPVYDIAVLADVLVLNSIEFWTGKNPVAQNEVREDTRVVEGKTVHTVLTAEKLRIEVKSQDAAAARVVEISYGATGAVARDGDGQLLSSVSTAEDGSVRVTDASGQEVGRRSGAELEAIASAVAAGSPCLAVYDSQERATRLATAR
ncbi:MAG: DUF3332 domain-containing protein [Myxococcales bacterium]